MLDDDWPTNRSLLLLLSRRTYYILCNILSNSSLSVIIEYNLLTYLLIGKHTFSIKANVVQNSWPIDQQRNYRPLTRDWNLTLGTLLCSSRHPI